MIPALGLLVTATVAFAFNSPKTEVQASPSSCPFVYDSGLDCLGVPDAGTPVVAGTKYKCSNGHTWIVKN